MRHLYDHVVQLVCLQSSSSDENKMLHKAFKLLYSTNNNHLDTVAPQQLRRVPHNFEAAEGLCDEDIVE